MIDGHIDYGVMGPEGKKRSIYFFALGILGALGVRLVLILSHFNLFWSAIAWYVAMFSYILFYYHRYKVEVERQRLVTKYNLLEKFKKEELTDLEKNELLMLLNSVMISKTKYNFLIWLIVTVLFLAIEITIDLVTLFLR